MGLLDSILGRAVGQILGGKDSNVVLKLIQSLIQKLGGIKGLVQKLQASGLQDILGSWISNASNQPVSSHAISSAFGDELMAEIANDAGVEPEQASSLLAEHLPEFINNLSPNGDLSAIEGFDLSDGLDMQDISALAAKFLK